MLNCQRSSILLKEQKANESACSVVAAMVTAGQLDANMVSGLIESLTELNFNLITKGAIKMSLSKIFNEELTLKYLTDTVREFKANKRGKRVMFSCPVCGKEEAANFIPNTGGKVFCLKCNKS